MVYVGATETCDGYDNDCDASTDEHADLDNLIDRAAIDLPGDELAVRRLKKRRLLLRDQISRIEAELDPPRPA